MLKFLRLYQGWILAIFGTFLVITFLLPQAISGLFQQSAISGGDWATVGDGSAITNGDYQQIQMELRVVENLGNPLLEAMGVSKDPAYWYLLTREANQAGLIGGAGVGREAITQMAAAASQQGQLVSETRLILNLMRGSGLPESQVLETLAKVQGVSQLASRFQTAARYSDERLRQAAADLALGTDADIVIIDATKTSEDTADEETAETTEATESIETIVIAVDPPDEATLQAQFDAHKSENPGEGDSGFGYKFPDRAQIEWISISKADLKNAMAENAILDPIEMRKEFIENPEAYGIKPTDAERPSFAVHAEQVRSNMLRARLDDEMAKLSKFLLDATQSPRRGLLRDGVYFKLPENWDETQANFTTVASTIATQFDITPPTLGKSDELQSAAEIDAVEGLGTANSTKFGQRPTRVSEFVFAAREFDNQSPIPAQVGIASPVFTDAQGNLYMFRVTSVDPARDPANLEEAREQVTVDATNLARFRALEAQSASIESLAIANGMQAVAQAYDSKVDFTPEIAKANLRLLEFGLKNPTRIRGLSNPESVVNAIVERAAALDFSTLTTELPAEDRTFVVADEEDLALVVVQLTAIRPLTQESWTNLATKGAMLRMMAREETAIDFSETFSLDALIERHNFKTVRSATPDDNLFDEADDDSDETTTTG